MPNYEYEDIDTGERHHKLSSWEDSKKYLEENPNLKRVIGAPQIVAGVGSQGIKVDNGFKEVMNKIKDGHQVRGQQMDKWTK